MMKEAFGEHGGRVRKPLRTAAGILCIGAEITAEMALKWPLQNRMAMARTETVFWYPAPTPATNEGDQSGEVGKGEGPVAAPSAPISLAPTHEAVPQPGGDQPQERPTGEGGGNTAPHEKLGGDGATGGQGDSGGADAGGAGDASSCTGQPPAQLAPINADTAERDELRAWLIAAGDDPAPALGTEKLRQRVRDRLAAQTTKEG